MLVRLRPHLFRWMLFLSIFFVFNGCLDLGFIASEPSQSPPIPNRFTRIPDSLLNVMLKAAVPDSSDFNKLHRTHAFLRKCENGDTVRVAFIGGSITGGALASAPALGFAHTLVAHLRRHYPQATFLAVHAGKGATNSRFACSRFRHEVLSHRPDLLFIDFAVNDAAVDSAASVLAYEGLLRQALASSDGAVWPLLFPSRSLDSVTVNRQIQLAQHYKLPTVNLLQAFRILLHRDPSAWPAFYQDDVHPNNSGHALIAFFLAHALESLQATLRSDSLIHAFDTLPAARHGDLFQHADGYSTDSKTLTLARNQGWQTLATQPFPGFSSTQVGDTLIFEGVLRESTLLYHVSKNRDAEVQIQVNSDPPIRIVNAFPEDWGGGYMKPLTLFRHSQPDSKPQKHRITLVHLSGGEFLLSHLLFAP